MKKEYDEQKKKMEIMELEHEKKINSLVTMINELKSQINIKDQKKENIKKSPSQ